MLLSSKKSIPNNPAICILINGRKLPETVTAKLKKIQTAYKKAEDSKKKSGGGRVVMTFYSICIEIWGGRPAIESLSDGFESSSVNEGTHKGSANGAVDDDDDEVQEDPFIDICICEGISDHGCLRVQNT